MAPDERRVLGILRILGVIVLFSSIRGPRKFLLWVLIRVILRMMRAQ
ncbi:MAG: hypothetical protein ACYCXP_10925 [Leptospirillum sp.]